MERRAAGDWDCRERRGETVRSAAHLAPAPGSALGFFIARCYVPYTVNACVRALRPSVIFRKVVGGSRAGWGTTVYAAATVIATGHLHGTTALAELRPAIAGQAVISPG